MFYLNVCVFVYFICLCFCLHYLFTLFVCVFVYFICIVFIVSLLLEHGADPKLRNNIDDTPVTATYDLKVRGNNKEMFVNYKYYYWEEVMEQFVVDKNFNEGHMTFNEISSAHHSSILLILLKYTIYVQWNLYIMVTV